MSLSVKAIESKWTRVETADDLEWDLGAITNRREAIDFLTQFENRFCVYSPLVKKLYTTYQFVVPDDVDCGHITVLPDPYAYHNTFHNLPREAVVATNIHLYPGETTGKYGLIMKIPSRHGLSRSRELPFAEGVRTVITEWREQNRLFLPVLQNGDLREYENRMVSLHLHTIKPEYLKGKLSDLELHGIRNVIADNLLAMFQGYYH